MGSLVALLLITLTVTEYSVSIAPHEAMFGSYHSVTQERPDQGPCTVLICETLYNIIRATVSARIEAHGSHCMWYEQD